MDKVYTVYWKIVGQVDILARSDELAEEVVANIEDPNEIIDRSIMVDAEVTGSHLNILGQ